MTDAQTWTLIAGLLAALTGFVGLVVKMFTLTLDDRDVNALARRFLGGA